MQQMKIYTFPDAKLATMKLDMDNIMVILLNSHFPLTWSKFQRHKEITQGSYIPSLQGFVRYSIRNLVEEGIN